MICMLHMIYLFISSCVATGFVPCDVVQLIDDVDIDDGTRNLLLVSFLFFFSFNGDNNTLCSPFEPFLLSKVDEEFRLSLFVSLNLFSVAMCRSVFLWFSARPFAMKENL